MIIELLSASRLMRYGFGSDSDAQVIARYKWNLELSEAFYPALSLLEVALRNRVDLALTTVFQGEWLDEEWSGWVRTPRMKSKGLPNPERDAILRTKQKLVRDSGSWNRDKLLAELNFGFWVGLFKPTYHPAFWIHKSRPLHLVFPENRSLKASTVYKMLSNIRLLRNRLAHHEAIFDRKTLNQEHQEIFSLLQAMSSELNLMARDLDRFPVVLNKSLNPDDRL